MLHEGCMAKELFLARADGVTGNFGCKFPKPPPPPAFFFKLV